ncbi:MAG TPA: hypothetical protein VKB30_03865 [Candidatus Limnocylindrales bacterium]|nr:hypothetical protein [Candidatus Limnocylindrales bacterium]
MSSGSRKKRQSAAQTVGGVLFGFEQQVLRDAPPPEELVHQARPDAPVPAGDGSFLTLELPDELEQDDPWAGIENELNDDDDPWADLADGGEAGTAPTARHDPTPADQAAKPERGG